MKRCFGFIFTFLISASSLLAQTSPEHVETIERMSKDIETLIAANADLQRRLASISEELGRVRQEQAKSANDTAVQAVREDLRQLAEKVQEVDRKRISDKNDIAQEVEKNFAKIEKLLKSGGNGGGSSARPTQTPSKPKTPIPSEGFEYEVRPGDTLLGIIGAANTDFKQQGYKSVTLQNVLDANPNLDPKRMRVGQKIFIPAYK